jgi:predicted phage tail protein
MTAITVHGILAKEFRSHFKFAIKSTKEVLDAITCICPQFRNRIVELSNQGVHYTLLINGKKIESEADLIISDENQTIDLMPMIGGAGGSFGRIIQVVVAVALIVAGMYFGQPILSAIGVALLTNALMKPPNLPRPESDVSSAKQSFNFSSKANVTEQGIPVPVGYGRLRVGSAIIQSNIKYYPQAFRPEDSINAEDSDDSYVNTK